MNRLRRISHEYLLPLVIGALALRALIPVGFMPGAGTGFSLTAMLCNAPAAGVRTETIEIPGTELPGATLARHCDYCVVPALGAAAALPAGGAPPASEIQITASRSEPPYSRFALDRAQIPRAPPLA